MWYKYTQGCENSCWYFQTKKKDFFTVQPENVCKLEFVDHLWLPFLGQPQSDIVVFAIIIFRYINYSANIGTME